MQKSAGIFEEIGLRYKEIAPVVQLDRIQDSGSCGCRFEPGRVHKKLLKKLQ